MATSTVGFVETVRTLDRVGSFPALMDDMVSRFTEVLLTDEIRDAAAGLPAGVRTLNAIHLASAQMMGGAVTALVTYDKRTLSSAAGIGIPVAAPGLH